MIKITKEKLNEIVKTLMFEPTKQVVNDILENWNKLQKQIKYFDKLDLTNVKPMSHINESYQIDFLREDEYNEEDRITKARILSNAPESDGDYLKLTKVVK
ncbi:Asp-tRNA(Asn)/Glu-tRNA(Gln) amidotransferase subunit GatC [Mycoplasma sp. 4423]